MTDSKQNKKATKSIAISTILVMLGLILSKGSGFLRDAVVASKMTGTYRDAYALAFNVPDLVYNLLIGGSIQAAITPSLAKAISRDEEKEGIRTVSIFITVFGILLAIVCVLCTIFSEPIYSLYAVLANKSGNPEVLHLAAKASQMLFPQIFFMTLAALCIGILNAYKRFASTSFGPTIYNIFVLLSILIFAGDSQSHLVRTMAGIMGAAVIYFLFQYIVGFDKLKQVRFIFKPTDKGFINLVKLAVPVLISASIVQINLAVLNSFAWSFGEEGLVFALRNASQIWQLPYGIFAVAVGNVMLPSLAALFSSKNYKEASELLSSRLKTALFMTIPSAGFLFLCSTETILVLLKWSSKFEYEHAVMAGTFLKGYSIAVITHTIVFIMNQAFYATGRTKVPLLAGVISLISNPVLCYTLIKLGVGAMSLTIAYSATSIIQLLVLCFLYCRNKELAPRNLLKFALKSAVCLITMCVVLFVLNKFLPLYDSKIKQIMVLGVKGVAAVITYFAMAFIVKTEEATYWASRFTSKLKRK